MISHHRAYSGPLANTKVILYRVTNGPFRALNWGVMEKTESLVVTTMHMLMSSGKQDDHLASGCVFQKMATPISGVCRLK